MLRPQRYPPGCGPVPPARGAQCLLGPGEFDDAFGQSRVGSFGQRVRAAAELPEAHMAASRAATPSSAASPTGTEMLSSATEIAIGNNTAPISGGAG